MDARGHGKDPKRAGAAPCNHLGMWFVVGMDRQLTGTPTLAGLYGPFNTKADAESYRPRVEENGATLEIVQSQDPATYPWPDPAFEAAPGRRA